MRVGVSGHQDRPNIKWSWARKELENWLDQIARKIDGWSCLAAGADQLFAETLILRGHKHTVVVPFDGYEKVFSTPEALSTYERLLALSDRVELKLSGIPTQEAYLKAGLYVVDSTDRMIVMWDGEEAVGRGGTGDVVEYAEANGKPVAILDPIHCVKKGDWS